jgi:hypothetical protein
MFNHEILYGTVQKQKENEAPKKKKNYRPGSNIRETKRLSPQPRYVLDKQIPIS